MAEESNNDSEKDAYPLPEYETLGSKMLQNFFRRQQSDTCTGNGGTETDVDSSESPPTVSSSSPTGTVQKNNLTHPPPPPPPPQPRQHKQPQPPPPPPTTANPLCNVNETVVSGAADSVQQINDILYQHNILRANVSTPMPVKMPLLKWFRKFRAMVL